MGIMEMWKLGREFFFLGKSNSHAGIGSEVVNTPPGEP